MYGIEDPLSQKTDLSISNITSPIRMRTAYEISNFSPRNVMMLNKSIFQDTSNLSLGLTNKPTSYSNFISELTLSEYNDLLLQRKTLHELHQNLERSGVSSFLKRFTGTYQEHSRVDVNKAVEYAEKIFGNGLYTQRNKAVFLKNIKKAGPGWYKELEKLPNTQIENWANIVGTHPKLSSARITEGYTAGFTNTKTFNKNTGIKDFTKIVERSGEMNRKHLRKVTKSFHENSTVNTLKATILSQLHLLNKSKSLTKTVKNLYQDVFSKYNISFKEFEQGIKSGRLSNLLGRRGAVEKEVIHELKSSDIKNNRPSIIQRVFNKTRQEDTRTIKSSLGPKELSDRIAFEHRLNEIPSIHIDKAISKSSLINEDINYIDSPSPNHLISTQEIKREPTHSSHINLTIQDSSIDMKSLDKNLSSRIKRKGI